MTSLENERFLRIAMIVFECGTFLAKHLLYKETSGPRSQRLDILLQSKRQCLLNHVSRNEAQKLFSSSKPVDPETWDFALLSKVLITVFSASLSQSDKDDLEAIRYVRHELCHAPLPALDVDTYQRYLKKLTTAIMNLCSNSALNPGIKEECGKIIEKYSKEDFDSASVLTRMKDFESVELFKTILSKFNEIKDEILYVREEVVKSKVELRDDIKVLKQELIELLQKKNNQGEIGFTVLGVKVKIEDASSETKKLIQDMFMEIVNGARTRCKHNPDDKELKEAIRQFLSEINKIKGAQVERAKKSSILLEIRCTSFSAVLSLLQYTESANFRQSLRNISSKGVKANRSFNLTGNITRDSCEAIRALLKSGKRNRDMVEHKAKESSETILTLLVGVSSPKALLDLWYLFQEGGADTICSRISSSFTQMTGKEITVSAELTLEQFRKAKEQLVSGSNSSAINANMYVEYSTRQPGSITSVWTFKENQFNQTGLELTAIARQNMKPLAIKSITVDEKPNSSEDVSSSSRPFITLVSSGNSTLKKYSLNEVSHLVVPEADKQILPVSQIDKTAELAEPVALGFHRPEELTITTVEDKPDIEDVTSSLDPPIPSALNETLNDSSKLVLPETNAAPILPALKSEKEVQDHRCIVTNKRHMKLHKLEEILSMTIMEGKEFDSKQELDQEINISASNVDIAMEELKLLKVFIDRLDDIVQKKGNEFESKLDKAVNNLLLSIGAVRDVYIHEIIHKCVLLKIRCQTCHSMRELLHTFQKPEFEKAIQKLSGALKDRCENITGLKMNVSRQSLQYVEDHLKENGVNYDYDNLLCENHPVETVKLYCSNHSIFCCQKCAHENHGSCAGLRQISTLNERNADFETADARENITEHKIKIKKDKGKCDIYGCCFLPNGEILVVDNSNKRLKKMNQEFRVVSHCNMDDKPWDVCNIHSNEAAVALYDCVQLVNYEGKLTPTRLIKFDHDSNGLTFDGKSFFVVDDWNVYIYSEDFKNKNVLYSCEAGTVWFNHVIADKEKNLLYISDRYGNVRIVTVEGNHVCTLKPDEFQNIWGICQGKNGKIFVTEADTCCIYSIDYKGDYSIIEPVIGNDFKLTKPMCLSYDEKTSKCIIGHYQKDHMTVLQL